MNAIIENIRNGLRVRVDSAVGAVQEFNDKARESGYCSRSASGDLKFILGGEYDVMNDDHARIQVAYVIQEAVSRHLAGKAIVASEVYKAATERANSFVKEEPWHFAKKDEEPKVDAEGKPKPKKGSKQILAAEVYQRLVAEGADRKTIIQAFQDEVDMSKAGATTYFYNMKKKFDEAA